ncbi:MAG: DNA replication and repair protein RecF [Microgenomates group bacterium Gr01-1014_5]|nr:MAG: DNA replication and repair protein RecF [Microgenomates group bacterium Gr01-1014_5]
MLIKNLVLQNFRSFGKKEFTFSEETTIIVGPNTAGKTNILEAISLLSTGKSFRASVEAEMIKSTEEVGRVMCEAGGGDEGEVGLEVVVTRGELNGEKIPRKKLMINETPKRFYDFVGTLKTVLFGPWDVDLVTGSPSARRRFLDSVCSQVDREYRRSLLSYEKGVRQRNKLLQRIREGEAKRSQLMFWDQLLIKNGEYLTHVREEFIDFVNMTEPLDSEELSLEYDRSTISPARIKEYEAEEVAAGATLVGPHRDDFGFRAQGIGNSAQEKRNLAIYGSRGEQRMVVLWLKLAELAFIDGKSGSRPVLLLDDVFSELDHKHREEVMKTIGRQQTIITTADPHTIEEWRKSAQIIEL